VGIPVVAELPACFRELEGPLNAGRLVASPPVALAGPVRGLLRDLGLRDAAVARGSSAWGTRGSRRQGRVGAAGSRRREAGQVAVESPLVVALMVALALVCLQLVLWGVSGLLARHAALEGARSASVSDDPGAIRQAVADAMPDQWGGPSAISTGGGTVRVTVRTPVLMPGLGGLDASSSASVLRERP
jgi:pilus assembly protein CpaE